MRLIVLGTGAGGGCPQWNCGCENCNFARNNPESARTTDSLAFAYEENGRTAWAIVNPGVDLRHQLARHPELQPPIGGGVRDTPIGSVILTDGELDHTMGLINLREGSRLKVFATAAVLDLMETAFPIKAVLRNYANLEFCTIVPGVPFMLGDSVKVTAVGLSDRQPRYASEHSHSSTADAVIGLKFEDKVESSSANEVEINGVEARCTRSPDTSAIAYAPQIGTWDKSVDSLLEGCEAVLVDGTFYTSHELQSLGVSAGSAETMGHLPLSGPNGILAKLENVKARIKLLTHINNTNPILRDNSTERRAVENAGVKIAVDGMSICSGSVYAPSCSTSLSTEKVGDKLRD
ncbi:MAG TPA: hypothetical protein EYN91_26630 [Candidatus Melainabacteria bacterium]|nr:hypothetical protein [Candidatus Melainabacteria bacterium]HIN66519.1 hypothetical protein [Candidatus Obscuribacterales bacterium]